MSGHSELNVSRSRRFGESDLCVCQEVETREHFLFHCERFARQRSEWLHGINLVLESDFVSPRLVHPAMLFGQLKDLSKEKKAQLLDCTLKFISNSKRFLR